MIHAGATEIIVTHLWQNVIANGQSSTELATPHGCM